jgi:hypothetical protein
MGPSPGGNDLTVEVLRMAISGPTATPKAFQGAGRADRGVIPYDRQNIGMKVRRQGER